MQNTKNCDIFVVVFVYPFKVTCRHTVGLICASELKPISQPSVCETTAQRRQQEVLRGCTAGTARKAYLVLGGGQSEPYSWTCMPKKHTSTPSISSNANRALVR